MNNQKSKIILLITGIFVVIGIAIGSYIFFNIYGSSEDPMDGVFLDEEGEINEETIGDPPLSESDERGYYLINPTEQDNSTVAIALPNKKENLFIFVNKDTGEIKESKDYIELEYIGQIPDKDLEEVIIPERKLENYIIYKKNGQYNIYNIKSNKKIEVPVEVDQVAIDSVSQQAYFLFDKDTETSQIYEYNIVTGVNKLVSNRKNIKWIQVSDNNLFYQASLNIYRYVDFEEYPVAQGLETISIKLGGLFNRAILEVDGVSYLYDYSDKTVKLNQLGFFVDPKFVVWSTEEREFYTVTENNIYVYNWITQMSIKKEIADSVEGEKFDLRDYDLDSMISNNRRIYIHNISQNKVYMLMDMTGYE